MSLDPVATGAKIIDVMTPLTVRICTNSSELFFGHRRGTNSLEELATASAARDAPLIAGAIDVVEDPRMLVAINPEFP